MQIKKVLNSKEIKKIEEILTRNYSCDFKLREYFVFINSDDKLWIVSKDIVKFETENLRRINSMGLYFGRLKKNNKISLSIEGCQLIGKTAKKNIVIVNEENMKKFFNGNDIVGEQINCEVNNFVLVKFKDDFIGMGILRDGKIENLLPKSRRLI